MDTKTAGPVMGPWDPTAVERSDWPKGTCALLLFFHQYCGYFAKYVKWSPWGDEGGWVDSDDVLYRPGEKYLAVSVQLDDGSWVADTHKRKRKGS